MIIPFSVPRILKFNIICSMMYSLTYPVFLLRSRGEMGYIRVEMGKNILGLEGEVAWATVGSWTEVNFPCSENGKNCNGSEMGMRYDSQFYVDPSNDVEAVQRRLQADN
jgi:hypothetical protein